MKNKKGGFRVPKVAKQSKGGSQAVTDCKVLYLVSIVSCLTGNHVFHFNTRYIIIATYACFLITSHNQLLLHSSIMRHPWSCSEFYQVWLLSPPFPSRLSNGHCSAHGMELSGSMHSQLQSRKQRSEVPFHLCFECGANALQISFFSALLQTYSWLFLPECKSEEVSAEMWSVFSHCRGMQNEGGLCPQTAGYAFAVPFLSYCVYSVCMIDSCMFNHTASET